MGVIEPRLKSGGTVPVSPIAEKRLAISGAMQSLPVLHTVKGIQPGPCEEEGLDLCRADSTSSVVIKADPAERARNGSIGWRVPAVIASEIERRSWFWEAGTVGLGAPMAA
jgi:hypothetical protein